MTRRIPPVVAAVIAHVATFNDALAGDFTEEWHAGRSRTWLCLEIIVALILHAWSSVRSWTRLSIDSAAADVAAVGVLSLCMVFTANLVARALEGLHWMPVALTNYRGWGLASGILSLAVALGIGGRIYRLRERHRQLAIFTFGASAMLGALVNVYLVPTAPAGAFFPSPILQTVVTAIFILGLSAGSSLTSTNAESDWERGRQRSAASVLKK